MTRDDKNMCRDIARLIVSDKKALDLFKDKLELAALTDCIRNNDPQPDYTYAYSYEAIIKMLLSFQAKLMPVWITPVIDPNGKMTDSSAASKSKTVSNIKGQLRIDRGAKTRNERIAGFYAWLNAYHPNPCEELHAAMRRIFDEDVDLKFLNIMPERLEVGKNDKTPKWSKLLSGNDDAQCVKFIDFENFSFNLVELSRVIKKDIQTFEIGAEFLFGVESDFEGHIVALQTYKGKTYALPLSTNAGLTALKLGQNFYPTDNEADEDNEVIPLSENTDLGVHQFIFLLFAGTPPHFDYTPLYAAGEAIHPQVLEALADKLQAYPKRHWMLCQIHINFR